MVILSPGKFSQIKYAVITGACENGFVKSEEKYGPNGNNRKYFRPKRAVKSFLKLMLCDISTLAT